MRVGRLRLLDTLREQPQAFCRRLYSHVYPGVAGSDHARLLYLFGLLEGQDKDSPLCGLSATEHARLLKKLRGVAPGTARRLVVWNVSALCVGFFCFQSLKKKKITIDEIFLCVCVCVWFLLSKF